MAKIHKEPRDVSTPRKANPLHFWIIKRYSTLQFLNPRVYARLEIWNILRHVAYLAAKSDWSGIQYEFWRIFGAKLKADGRQLPESDSVTATGMDRNSATRIAVVMHVHYPDIWPELKAYLENIPVLFDLYVSLTDTRGFNVENNIRQSFPNATIAVMPNRGRDILGFQKFSRQVLDPSKYDLVCKIHSKTSAHIANGDEWRRDLLDGVLGSPERIKTIISRFNANAKIGMIAGSSCFASYSAYTRSADLKSKINWLAHKIGTRQPGDDDCAFVAGTMFWARVKALEDLRNLGLADEDFEAESNQSDGLLAHAYERFVGVQVHSKGFIYSAMPTHLVRPFWLSRPYRYLQGFAK